MLKLENIAVNFDKNTKIERKILNKLNLFIESGEFVVIVGCNGAGKSTLLNSISGLVTIDSGKISILNSDITKTSQFYRAKFISQVIQDPRFGTIANMTIAENMAFALMRGQRRSLKFFINKNQIEIFREKLSVLGIGFENRMNDLVSCLSGGQRQILSIVMSILRESNVLLLDEITSALDPISSEMVMRLANKIIREQKIACIMITHNMSHAIRYGDRLLLLKNGNFIKEYNITSKANITQTELIDELEAI